MSILSQKTSIRKKNLSLNALLIFFMAFMVSCRQHNADFILRNAHIYTVNSTFDTASVMAVKDGKILAIGGDEVLDAYHALNIINMQGAYIYPGFIDAHTHFTGYAMDKYKLVLYGSKSFEEMVGKVVEYARTSKREWIEGRLWDHQLWPNKEFPTKDTLDILFPNRPVFLMRIDGHAILCNQKALDLAGVNEHTKVEGGELVLKNGKLTGLLIDNAVDLVKQKIPTRTKEEEIPDIVLAQKDCFKVGLTSVVECGISNKVINWLIEMSNKKTQTLKIGLTAFLSDEEANYKQFLNNPIYSNGYLKIVGYKIFADGSLGSRGAYLTEAYSDRHEHKGQLLKSVDSIKAIALRIVGTPYQLSVHAIGDGTNHEILRICSEVLDQHNDRRWRIEHAQVVKKDDLPIFEKFHIIPSVQPTHAISDMSWAESRLGVERIKTAYAYQDLLRQNQWLPLGTDFPVEDLNPLNTFCAAVFRQNHELKPEKGYQMENALSREQALKGITIWAAKSTFEESSKGSLEVGKQADFVVLPTDLMTATADSIYKTKVIYTYVKGERVFPDR